MGIVVAAIAVIALLALLIDGGGDHEGIFGQEREGFEERGAQVLVAAPTGLDPAPVTVSIVEQSRDRVSPETLSQLEEVRDLLTSAADQPPEQAPATLQQADERLDSALSQVETAVDEAPDQLTRIRLLHLQRVLEAIQASVEARLAAA
jgi:hypothetical protein